MLAVPNSPFRANSFGGITQGKPRVYPGLNGAKLRGIWGSSTPRRGYRIQPGVSYPFSVISESSSSSSSSSFVLAIFAWDELNRVRCLFLSPPSRQPLRSTTSHEDQED
jgi:hypothetical protein